MPADGIYLSDDRVRQLEGDLWGQDANAQIADAWGEHVKSIAPDLIAQTHQQIQQERQDHLDDLASQFQAGVPGLVADHVASLTGGGDQNVPAESAGSDVTPPATDQATSVGSMTPTDVPSPAGALPSSDQSSAVALPPVASSPFRAPSMPAPVPASAGSDPTAPVTATMTPATGYEAVARAAAQKYGIDPDIFARQISQESGFNPNAVSPAGARGIAQFMPETARGLGINPDDPAQALEGAARYMAQLVQNNGGDIAKALAAYNAGQGNVDKYGGVPPFAETQRYVANIVGGAGRAVQNAGQALANTGAGRIVTAAVNNVVGALRPSQFGVGLSDAEAYAACGPVAAMAFARATGQNPTAAQAVQLAKQVGWTPQQGMAGPSSELDLLKNMGVPAHMEAGADPAKIAQDVQNGNPVIISTPGHYFVADSYDPRSGAFHVGSSGTDLKAGSEWMSLDQMQKVMGTAQATLYLDRQPGDGPSYAAQQQQSQAAQATDQQAAQVAPSSPIETFKQKMGDAFSDLLAPLHNLFGGLSMSNSAPGPQSATGLPYSQTSTPSSPEAVAQPVLGDVGNAIAANQANPPLAGLGSEISGSGLNQVRSQIFPNVTEPGHPTNQPFFDENGNLNVNTAIAFGGVAAPLGAKFDRYGVAINQSPEVQAVLKGPQYDQYGVEQGFVPPTPTGALAPQTATRYYHGTGQAFDVVDPARLVKGEGVGDKTWGPGFYLTENPARASTFATRVAGDEGAGANVRPVDVPPTLNLLDANQQLSPDRWADLLRQLGQATDQPSLVRTADSLPRLMQGKLVTDLSVGNAIQRAYGVAGGPRLTEVNAALQQLGYDGITHGEDLVIFPGSVGKLGKSPGDLTAPTLGRDVASTLPPGSGPLAPAATTQESTDTLQGLLQMARSRGVDTSTIEPQLPKPPVPTVVNPFALHTQPGPGFVPMTEEDIANHLEDLGTRYEANDARIQQLENQLGGGSLAPGASGVQRPPWAVGITNDALQQIARDHGTIASTPFWWEKVGLQSGSGELRENVGQGGYRGIGRTQLTPAQARAEMNQLIAENEQIMSATEIPEDATTLYRAPFQPAAELPWQSYTEPANAAATVPASSAPGPRPAAAGAQSLGTDANQSSPAANPPNAPAGVGTPLSLKPVATGGGTSPPITPQPTVPATPPPPPPGSLPAAVGAVPPSVPTGGANAWDYLRALRVGSLAGGVQTISHIVLNAPLQAAFKVVSDAPLSVTRPETIPLEFMGAWQGLRGWASNAVAAPLGQPSKIAQSIGGTTGSAVETGLLGLVKTHPVIQDMANQIGTGMELWRRAGIEASNAGLARFSGPWWTEVQNLVANPTADMLEAAQQSGSMFALRGPMGSLGTAIGNLRGGNKLIDFAVPFFNIGYHVATQGIERSPLGLVGTATDVARAPLGSGPYAAGANAVAEGVTPLAQRLRNNMVGVGLAVEAYHQAAQGNITGNGPTDPKLRADLLATGWQPDSVRIGGRYFPLHSLGFAGWPLAEAANLYEATHTGDEGGYATPASTLPARFGDYLERMAQFGENETFLRSIGQLLQAATNSRDAVRQGEQIAAGIGESLIPQGALLSNIASAADPFMRRPAPGDIGQAIQNRLPGMRQDLPLKLTPTGQPVQNASQGFGVLLPRSSIAAPDPVIQAMGAAGVGAPTIPKTVSVTSKYQMDLTPNEQQTYQELHGQALNDQLKDVVTDPDWKTLSVDRQRQFIQRALAKASDVARKQLLDGIPDDQIEGRVQLKSDALAGTRVTVGAAP